jgi:hypothetical protein
MRDVKLTLCIPFLFVMALPAQVPDKIDVDLKGKPFTTFYSGVEEWKPYLAPIRAASGTLVTRHFPIEKVEGESKDHLHHRGLWFSYDDVNGTKFWENDPSYKTPNRGKIVVKKAVLKGSVIEGVFDWVDENGKTLLVETRRMTFRADADSRIIDFDITLTANGKIVFGDTKEGAFAIRLADALGEKNGGKMVNADGLSGMKDVWGKRSNWVDYSGAIDGEKLGVAILDHPSNPRHPTYWHSRDYALFALNPFGQHAFDPSQPESHWELESGKSLRFRWEVIVHPGDAVSAHIADLYQSFAK